MFNSIAKKDIWKLGLLTLILGLMLVLSIAVREYRASAPLPSGSWVYGEGVWYYEIDGERVLNNWVEDHDYFVDEAGRMVRNEWIYELKEGGGYGHSRAISLSYLPMIDTDRLCYVGNDGRIIRKKTIYFTPFKFDPEGYCSISMEDIGGFEGAECGIEGLRRYVVFNGGYKEYY